MTVIIAEKPSLARNIASAIGDLKRRDGYLEGEGYIYSVPGKGSFAAGHKDADAARREELLDKTRALIAELRVLGVSEEELESLVKEEPK